MKRLRDFTMARVGLGRAGNSLPTAEVLAFQLAHAQARDAVYRSMDLKLDVALQSAARNREEFLRRPDLGRRLATSPVIAPGPFDIAIAAVDGLSALAVDRHAQPLLERFLPLLDRAGWSRAPLMTVAQGRVAIGDEIGELLQASLVLVLIGERPGLSSPDSLGAYLTWNPQRGRTDAERNCISNIRPEGLGYRAAADRIFALATAARNRRLTGVALKEDYRALEDPTSSRALSKLSGGL